MENHLGHFYIREIRSEDAAEIQFQKESLPFHMMKEGGRRRFSVSRLLADKSKCTAGLLRRHQADDAGPLRMAMILVPRLSCYPEDLPKKELSVIIDKSGDFGEYDHQAPCEQDRECGITSLICERTTGSGESVHEKPAGGR